MNKKERLSEFNRNNILTAAKRLFYEKGAEHTTMDDIAKAADYSKSTIYVYFKSKDDIYNHIVLEHFELLKAALTEALDNSPSFPDGYFAVCNASAGLYKKYPLIFESLLGEVKQPINETDTALINIYKTGDEITALIMEYLTNWTAAGHIALNVPPLNATLVLQAGITGVIMMAHNKEPYIKAAMGVSKEEFMQDGFRMLLRSITGGAL